MLVPACRCCCRTTRRARTWKTLQKLSHHRRVYVPKYVYSLLLLVTLYKPHVYPPLNPSPRPPTVYLSPIIYYYYLCSSHPPPPQTTKKILDKNDEKILVVMCVVNKLTHLPALPVRSYWLLCFSLPNFGNRICLRFSTTILQIANSYLYAKYLLEWFSLFIKNAYCVLCRFFAALLHFFYFEKWKKKIRTTEYPLFVIDKPMWKSSYYTWMNVVKIYKIRYELVPI